MDHEIVCPHCGAHLPQDAAPLVLASDPIGEALDTLAPESASSTELGALNWLPSVPDPILKPLGSSASSSDAKATAEPPGTGGASVVVAHLIAAETPSNSASETNTEGESVEISALLNQVPSSAPPVKQTDPGTSSGVVLIGSSGSVETTGVPTPSASPLAKIPSDADPKPQPGPVDFLSSLMQGYGPAPLVAVDVPAHADETLPGFDLSANQAPTTAPTPTAVSSRHADEAGEEDDDDERPTTSWTLLLLGSYASAMTLACIYLLWFGPGASAPAPESFPTDSRSDRGGQIREVATPIPEGRITTVGKPLRVGLLELTPLAVKAGHSALEHHAPDGAQERSDGGAGSLILQLRLRNLSPKTAFTPVERAFVRHSDRGTPASYIELETGGLLENYPLTLDSERSIIGQSFESLGPNQARDFVVVSNQGSLPLALGSMIWRLRVGTGPNQSETVGVQFDDSEIVLGK